MELDGAHLGSDMERDEELALSGYKVLSFRPGAKGYYEEVQSLVESIEFTMDWADVDEEQFAIKREVCSYEPASRF